ncbi:MAG: DUF4363 family protein [Eubacterium sp.]|nr:DUF4363 family protein [Eubacterium sp.]
MKRLWFAGIFLLIAVFACSYEQFMVKYTYTEINEMIDKALQTDDSSEKAEFCNEIAEKWDEKVRVLTLFTDHSITQSADVSFGTLKSLAQNNSENIDETLIETKSEIHQIYENSKVNLSNIF